MRDGYATISDLIDYFGQFEQDTIVVLTPGETTELEGAISMATVLDELEDQRVEAALRAKHEERSGQDGE